MSMRSRINIDGQDESEFLPPEAELIKPERLAKGDIYEFVDEDNHAKGKKSFAWMPDELWAEGFITEDNLHTAETIKRIRDCHSRLLEPGLLLGIQKIGGASVADETKKVSGDDLFRALIGGLWRNKQLEVKGLNTYHWLLIRDIMALDRLRTPLRYQQMFMIVSARAKYVQECYESAQEKLARIYKAW